MTRRAWWTSFAALGVVGAAVLTRATSESGSPARQPSAAEANYCALVESYKTSLGQLRVAAGSDELVQATTLIEQAKEYAPPAIKADMETFASAYRQVASALESTDFRSDAGGADLVQPVQTPAVDAALRRIAAYDKRMCAIG